MTTDRSDVDRARAELAASGETVAPRNGHPVATLTPQELQVALLVGGGATNREVGAALFLTPKTIEFHLAKIYRKLDLRSRTELANWLASHAVADAPTARHVV
jgi:DNA-binding CsgD family transcriptional regulator